MASRLFFQARQVGDQRFLLQAVVKSGRFNDDVDDVDNNRIPLTGIVSFFIAFQVDMLSVTSGLRGGAFQKSQLNKFTHKGWRKYGKAQASIWGYSRTYRHKKTWGGNERDHPCVE